MSNSVVMARKMQTRKFRTVLKRKNKAKMYEKHNRIMEEEMLKGAQKRMIVVKTSDSEIFEEAYFVMKGGVERSKPDMVFEANRIIEGCSERRKEKRRESQIFVIPLLCFMIGTLFGGGAVALIAFLAL